MKVLVCTWEPQHTVEIAEGQRKAVHTGVIAALHEECGGDLRTLTKKLSERSLVTVKTVSGVPCCARCGTPMEWLYSQDGIEDRLAAIRDVAEEFDKAFERTRRRNSGRKEDDEEEGGEEGGSEEGEEGDP
jgi:hypothetical protein